MKYIRQSSHGVRLAWSAGYSAASRAPTPRPSAPPRCRTISGRRPRRALDLRAMPDAALGGIEGVAAMHGAAIVPQHQVADAPGVQPGVFIARRQRPELVEQRLGLRELETDDVGVAAAAQIKAFATGLRVGADQRVHGARRGPGIVAVGQPGAEIAAAVVGAVVFDLEPGEPALHRLAQALIAAVHAAKAGIAARRRDLDGVEHARHRRILEIGHVGVPRRLAGAQTADGDAVLDDVGDHVYLGLAVDETAAVLLHRRPVERAET